MIRVVGFCKFTSDCPCTPLAIYIADITLPCFVLVVSVLDLPWAYFDMSLSVLDNA